MPEVQFNRISHPPSDVSPQSAEFLDSIRRQDDLVRHGLARL